MERQRAAIIELFENGNIPSAIMNILNIAKGKAIVCISHYNRYEETGGVQDRARSGRPTSITNTSMRNVIRSRILRNPSKSMRKCPPSSVYRDAHCQRLSKRT